MLEIRNLTKIYKTKGGENVKALDGVSLKFEGTGLVFLLGKSGSGKSTLLNLAGGLDEPTEGEIVVMGRSSKDFSGSDFDSYRNTFVGFVFQEYNVLNEFNVEDNVSLALELQGKTREKEKVKEILEEVELGAFAKRKPNTLSGGQKQRIAIARALVKDPQIILADEPTGALDSATGKQVFETLKHLSKTRLVLVVSHDREFAETYGDRIVELKDGKVISDVTKTREAPLSVSGRVRRIGENTLSVRGGTPDTETMRAIEKFLSEGKGEVLLSKGEEENRNYKRANRIDENGARERFVDTDESKLAAAEYKETKFIRSKLPARKAIRIGASGLKLKPFRLVLTILLSVVSFMMFGLFSTMMFYDGNDVLVHSFATSDYHYTKVVKGYNIRHKSSYDNEWYEGSSSALFTLAEVSSFGTESFGAYETWGRVPSNVTVPENKQNYYMPQPQTIAYVPEGNPLRDGLIGKYPAAKDEVAVSSYFLDCLRESTFRSATIDENGAVVLSKDPKPIVNAQDLIGETLVGVLGDSSLKVTGVFDSGAVPHSYDSLKDSSSPDFFSTYRFTSYLQASPHLLVLLSEDYDFRSEATGNIYHFEGVFPFSLYQKDSDVPFLSGYSAAIYDAENKSQLPVTFLKGKEKTTLSGNELILDGRYLGDLVTGYLYELYPDPESPENFEYPPAPDPENFENDPDKYNEAYEAWKKEDNRLKEEAERRYEEEYSRVNAEREKVMNSVSRLFYGTTVDPETGETVKDDPTPEELAEATEVFLSVLEQFLQVPISVVSERDGLSLGEAEIVGYFRTDPNEARYETGVYCSEEFFEAVRYKDMPKEETETKYVPEADATFPLLFASLPEGESAIDAFMQRMETVNEETDVFYRLDNVLYSSVDMANDLVETLSTVFLVVGIVLALFAALLLFNFISMSISNKKKEIGILRAVGARGMDVFKIFFSESGIIVGICTVLALAGSIAATKLINDLLRAEVGLEVTLFMFGPLSAVVMVGVAATVALVSTFLPVFFAARKKPVETIRAL